MKPPQGIEEISSGEWVVAGDTHLGLWAKQRGTIVTDPNLFRWLKPYLRGVEVVFDLGANIGDHSRQYLDWGMRVVAFEPNPLTYECLAKNCPEALCMKVAASDTAGVATFASLDNVGASRIAAGGEIQVITIALDDINGLPEPGFIKVDVEGHEVFAIMGMAGTITRNKPTIFCEMNPGALAANGHSVEGLRDLIESLGYEATALYPPQATWNDEQFDCLFSPISLL